MDFKDKADSLAAKMNAITQKLDLTEELLVEGDDIVEYVEDHTKDITLYKNENYAEIMNIEAMTADFKYVRDSLREVSDNARRVQNSITLDLIDTKDDGKRAGLIMSFAELSKAITDAQKLYVQSYREMSTTLLNLDKIKKTADENEARSKEKPIGTTYEARQVSSTAELLKQLKKE